MHYRLTQPRLLQVMRLALGALALFVLGPALAQEVPTVTFTVQRFIVEGENPLTEAETNAVLAPYTGEQEGLGALLEAAQALETMMRERGYTFHRVTIPPQTSATGEFLLDVVSFKLNEIEFQGNVHFSDENLRRSLPVLVPGTTPNARLLSRYVQAANEHPSKRLNVTVRTPNPVTLKFTSTPSTATENRGQYIRFHICQLLAK